MAFAYTIRDNFPTQWQRGQELALDLAGVAYRRPGASAWLIHGDPALGRLDNHDLSCYFVYTLSSWWEVPVIDRINAGRRDNAFAVITDVNAVPETYFRISNSAPATPRARYISGLTEMFPSMDTPAATAMFERFRNGFSHNLFGREPGRINFSEDYACPPILDDSDVLLVPPAGLALSMVRAFVPKIAMLFVDASDEYLGAFKTYMTGPKA